jgi:hypothetical protein
MPPGAKVSRSHLKNQGIGVFFSGEAAEKHTKNNF